MKNCPKCNTPHSKPGIFCSRSCANARVHSTETRAKISKTAKANPHGVILDQSKRGRMKRSGTYAICPTCSEEFYRYPGEQDKKYCSRKCSKLIGVTEKDQEEVNQDITRIYTVLQLMN